MKIIISGPHDSGKTTFCNYMYEKYNYPIIFEGSQELMNAFDYSYIHKKHHLFFQAALTLYEQKKTELFLSFDKCIMDRCALDIIAYTNYAYEVITNKNHYITEIYKLILANCKILFDKIRNQIDLYVFVKNQNTNDYYAKEIENQILETLKKYRIDFYISECFPANNRDLINQIINSDKDKFSDSNLTIKLRR